MDREQVLGEVLRLLAEQEAIGALALANDRADASLDPWLANVAVFAAFMNGRTGAAVDDDRDPAGRLMNAVAQLLAAARDPHRDADDALVTIISLAGDLDPHDRTDAFARYVALEATLAAARVDLAIELHERHRSDPPAHVVWADHPYAPVMLACVARIEIFAGNVTRAQELLQEPVPSTVAGELVRATKALAAAYAADQSSMRSLIAAVETAQVPPTDHLGRGVHLLLAFSGMLHGDTLNSVGHLLRAGGGADLENLTIIDRVLGYELLITAAAAEGDLLAAEAWRARAADWAGHPTAAPTVSRIESQIALLAGDLNAAEAHATAAVDAAARQARAVEQATAELARARARILQDQVPEATRDLRIAVAAGDRTGFAAVRMAATRELRPTRRRLPPPAGGGWKSLSVRERAVAELILAGFDNAEIAAGLSLSPTTVRTHTTRILTAFDVATRIGLLAATCTRPTESGDRNGLTARQSEVAARVAAGRTNAEIAEDLGISVKSVERHVTDILLRWEVRSRFDLAHRWWRQDLAR